jgi:energy-coupling factor transporter ATP-binding protein EcfA2
MVRRRLGSIALERFAEESVLLLQGPRAVGKSTLLRWLAERLDADVVDLDDVATRDAVASDPKPFVWHKTADEILDRLAGYCAAINGTEYIDSSSTSGRARCDQGRAEP